MTHRRILYGAVLAAAVLYQILYRGWLSSFALVLVVALPFFSLAVSLPGLLRATLVLTPEPAGLLRGQTGAFVLSLHAPGGLGGGRATLRLTVENRLTGDRRTARRTLRGGVLREKCPAPHCGTMTCAVSRARICDLSGLFSFPLLPPAEAAMLVLPLPAEAELPPEVLGGRREGTSLKPRPGGGPGEDYDLRGYRPGDPLRSVHWKLSSKWDDLVVRETLEPRRSTLVLTYDHFGTPEDLDETFDTLAALSRRLLEKARPHRVQWAEPVSGAVRDFPVSSEEELAACLSAAFSSPAPGRGRSILDAPLRAPGSEGPVRHFHVAPGGRGKEGAP